MKIMLSSEFVEEYKKGRRIFDGINLQFARLWDHDFRGITVKNSRLFFISFFRGNLRDSKFINCEMYFPSFQSVDLTDAVFEKCKIELGGFDNALVKNTKITRSDVSWSTFFGVDMGNIDFLSSALFKTFSSISQVTQEDADEVMRLMGPVINSLDISIRAEIIQILKNLGKEHGFRIEESVESNKTYSNPENNYQTRQSSYGSNSQNLMDLIIDAYNNPNAYKTGKKGYSDDKKGY